MVIVNLGKALVVALGFALPVWLFGLLTDFSAPGWLADLAPWRSTHVLLAAISTMCLLPLLLLCDPERREVEASPNAPFRIVDAVLWSRRAFLGPPFARQFAGLHRQGNVSGKGELVRCEFGGRR